MHFEKIALVRSAVMDGLNAWVDAESQRTRINTTASA
jgi:hypothetical protein